MPNGVTPRSATGDFDWGGPRVANGILERFPVQPWRFRTGDYRAVGSGRELVGRPVIAAWDPDPSPALDTLAVEEEMVVDDLIGDLAAAGR